MIDLEHETQLANEARRLCEWRCKPPVPTCPIDCKSWKHMKDMAGYKLRFNVSDEKWEALMRNIDHYRFKPK